MKKIISSFLALVLLATSSLIYVPTIEVKASNYTEMTFGHWGTNEGVVENSNIYSLTNKTISSLDGVAISGKVDFSTPGKILRIGGTDAVKHGGFWFWNGEGILHLSPQGIGGDGFDMAAIHGEVWNSVKNGEFILRLTFDKVATGWAVGIYVNGDHFQTLTCPGVNSTLTPGVYIGIDPGLNVDMTIPQEPDDSEEQEKEYTEMAFGHWGASEGVIENSNIYSLTDKTISSLDGVAISGKVDFSTPGKILRIGGTDGVKHGGFWFWNGEGILHLSPQGIGGDGFDMAAIHGEVWNSVKDKEFMLRLTFDKVATGWAVGIYVNGNHFQTLICPGVNSALRPGLYIGIDPGLTVDMTIPSAPEETEYTEMKFKDWTVNEGELHGTNIFRLGDSAITSLDGVAISGKVNFSNTGAQIRVGGTDAVKHGGFWLWNDGTQIQISPQGIGGDGLAVAAIYGDVWNAVKDKDFTLRLTFDKTATGWDVGIYVDGTYFQTISCPGVNAALKPGLYIGIDPKAKVDMDVTEGADGLPQHKMTDLYTDVKWSGRTSLLNYGVAIDQAASGMEFTVETAGKVTVTADVTADTYFTVYIDGVRQEERQILTRENRTMTVAEFATAGVHTVRIVKQTEAQNALCILRSIGFAGELAEKPEDKEMYLEFIGDSITCGFGNLTDDSNPDSENALYEDATLAFPFVAAGMLEADVSVLGASGMGAAKSIPDFVAKDYYTAVSYLRNAAASYDFVRVPDYVVINLGTNDYAQGATKSEFQNAVKELVTKIRGAEGYNAQVPIIWTDGLMGANVQSWVTETFAELGGKEAALYVLAFQHDPTGGGAHPAVAGHEAAATVLADFIQSQKGEEKTYTELTFSNWNRYVDVSDGCTIYGLPKDTPVQSLNGVAISGTVNFSEVGQRLRIGGTKNVKHGGFWLWNGDGVLHLSPQGIGGDSYDQAAIYGDAWNEVKDGEFTLRLTFDQVATGWEVGIYVNETYFQTLTCPGVNTLLIPGLYMSADSAKVAPGLGDGLEDSPSDEDFKYTELSFSDWSKFVTISEGSYIYSLKGHKNVLSLDGVAISGKVNFGGKSGYIRIGGTKELPHAGFWIWNDGESLRLSPQGIGNVSDFWVLSGDDAKAYFDKEFTLRVAFKRNVKIGVWNVQIFIDGKEIGTYNCGNVSPGMYLGVDPSVVIDGKKQGGTDKEKTYREMSFADWNMYLGETSEFDIYSLDRSNTLKSLDGVAISGVVNFNGTKNKNIRIGGIKDNPSSGFWLFSDGDNLRLSPQGIGGSGDYWVLTGAQWKPFKNKDIKLRLTFDKDKKTGAWFVGVSINGKTIGDYLCGMCEPGLNLVIDHGVDVEGLGEELKNRGIDFTLWGYSNKNWRKEMGLK